MFSSVSKSAAARVFASSVLPTPVGPEEQERADGAPRILDPGATAQDGVGDQVDGLVLADHPLVQDLGQAEQLLALALLEATHGDAGPAGDDVGDLLLGDDLPQQPAPPLPGGQQLLLGLQATLQFRQLAVLQLGSTVQVVGPLGLLRLVPHAFDLLAQRLHLAQGLALGLPLGPRGVGLPAHVGQLLAQLLQATLAGLVLLLGQGRLLDLQAHHAATELVELGRHRVDLGAEHGAGLVDEVDGLVGQEPVRDVPVAEDHGAHQGGVLDLDAVEDLEPLLQASQDRQGVLDGRFVDEHGLEPALESGVLLHVLAILHERGGADHVELTPGEHGLEHVPGVHRPLRRSRRRPPCAARRRTAGSGLRQPAPR